VAPMCRSSGGAFTAIIDWLHYADPALAPMRRSSIGSYTAIRDMGSTLEIERRLKTWMKDDKAARAIAEIPGVGPLSATAAVATMGDPGSFKSGREFAAWLGLVPGQTGTGGKIQLLGISKRGDTYLRTLLIHGARSVLSHAKQPGEWLDQLKKRRPPKIVTVALANKMARIIWAMLAHDRPYNKDHVSTKPA
jgi:transposase